MPNDTQGADSTVDRFAARERRAFFRSAIAAGIPILIAVIATWYTANLVRNAAARVTKANADAEAAEGRKVSAEREYQDLQARVAEAQKQLQQLAEKSNKSPQSRQVAEDAFKTVWDLAPPEQGWCYQEKKDAGYGVHCHWSQDRCNKAKEGSQTATGCILIPHLRETGWHPRPKGWMDSWFQDRMPAPLPPPFPQP